MIININGKDKELKFSYNSFRHMDDFNLDDISMLETNPFKILGITEKLLIGALNHNPKDVVRIDTIIEYLENVLENESITDLLEELMELLEKSSFFKNLQKTPQK